MKNKGSRKKVFFSGRPLRGGGGEIRGFPLMFFIYLLFIAFYLPLSRGGRAKGLSGLSTKKLTLFAASLRQIKQHVFLRIYAISVQIGISFEWRETFKKFSIFHNGFIMS